MITVRDCLELAIDMDKPKLVYYIYWALSHGFATLEDDSFILDDLPYQLVEIEILTKLNPLKIGDCTLYIVESAGSDCYAFYFARSETEASTLHRTLFQEKIRKVHFAPHLMGKSFFIGSDLGKSEILYFYRKTVVHFPYFLGYAFAGERVLWRE